MSTNIAALPALKALRADAAVMPWLIVLVFTSVCLALRTTFPWIVSYPAEWVLPLSTAINIVVDSAMEILQPLSRAISVLLEVPMRAGQAVLQWLPWPAVMMGVCAVAYRFGGIRLAIFAFVSLSYLLLTGYWRQSMNTLALVLLAVPISVFIGFGLGAIGHLKSRFRGALEAVLDLMQTVPAFAYLIPLLLLFGFGPVVGLIASAIYAIPPMVRNTMLGLDLVPADVKDAGIMGGCTRWQRFWLIEVPTAMPQMLVGFNQTTMAALSMVIVASIIGGFEDIGWEVLSSMRKAEFGQSLLSGIVIALLAILIDRITLGIARDRASGAVNPGPFLSGQRLAYILLAALVIALLLRWLVPVDILTPFAQAREQIGTLNRVLLNFVTHFGDVFENIRNTVFYVVILPLRVGISGAAVPAIWGFILNPTLASAYIALVAALSLLFAMRLGWRPAIATCLAGAILFHGLLGFPWPAFIAIMGLLAFRLAGLRIAGFAVGGLTLILVSGLWNPFMQSIYLCGIAVVLCLLIGGALGLWAAHSNRVSAILRPINDALQTMPQFVFLIPVLMLFKVGEFTALIAIMLYAIVPPIRYVEHGFRNVRPDVVEAARQMGSTPAQLVWLVKLPMALPVLMLGVNQTIMAAISMLAIAAMVGTRDLGQHVYLALGKADSGQGMVAGLSIAFIALASDRIIQTWLRRHRPQ